MPAPNTTGRQGLDFCLCDAVRSHGAVRFAEGAAAARDAVAGLLDDRCTPAQIEAIEDALAAIADRLEMAA